MGCWTALSLAAWYCSTTCCYSSSRRSTSISQQLRSQHVPKRARPASAAVISASLAADAVVPASPASAAPTAVQPIAPVFRISKLLQNRQRISQKSFGSLIETLKLCNHLWRFTCNTLIGSARRSTRQAAIDHHEPGQADHCSGVSGRRPGSPDGTSESQDSLVIP